MHCAAVGVLKTLAKNKNAAVPPPVDYRYMINVVTSESQSPFHSEVRDLLCLGAIVNTPPPNGVISMVSSLATKTHKTMHYCQTDETMVCRIPPCTVIEMLTCYVRCPFSPLKQAVQFASKNLSWANVIGAASIGILLQAIFYSTFESRKRKALARLLGERAINLRVSKRTEANPPTDTQYGHHHLAGMLKPNSRRYIRLAEI